ncbi:MAG: tyrosine/phenylalanine carboxypeptidase domain-containing protein [Patescibacteria group bacterium]
MGTVLLDEDYARILESLPAFPFGFLIRPNLKDAKKQKTQFFETQTPPIFSYPRAERFDVSSYLLKLQIAKKQIQALTGNPIIHSWYIKKLEELELRANLIEAIQTHDAKRLTKISTQLYGTPTCSLQSFADELSNRQTGRQNHVHNKKIDAENLKKRFEKKLQELGLTDWSVSLSRGMTIKLKHGHAKNAPRILIPKRLLVSRNRAKRLLIHEIEVHALRTDNGRKSNLTILGRGLPFYTKTEEGLAMYMTHKKLPNQKEQIPGFWDAWAVCLALNGNFATTFETLQKAKQEQFEKTGCEHPEEKARDAAWRLCLRTYRGITDTSQKNVAFVQGHIYRDGFLEIEAAVKKDPGVLEKLFVGNVGLGNLGEISSLCHCEPSHAGRSNLHE